MQNKSSSLALDKKKIKKRKPWILSLNLKLYIGIWYWIPDSTFETHFNEQCII